MNMEWIGYIILGVLSVYLIARLASAAIYESRLNYERKRKP